MPMEVIFQIIVLSILALKKTRAEERELKICTTCIMMYFRVRYFAISVKTLWITWIQVGQMLS